MPPQVSVAVGKKPKPKEAFKFLRRDEGRLSYSQQPTPDSPMKGAAREATPGAASTSGGDAVARERRDSKSLREAIASDMRKAKSHDYLAEVVVAVPKKAPPAARPETVAEPRATAVARRATRPASARPPWVEPEVPAYTPPPRERDSVRSESSAVPPRNNHNTNNNVRGGTRGQSFGDVAEDDLSAAERVSRDDHAWRRGGAVPRYVDPHEDDDIDDEDDGRTHSAAAAAGESERTQHGGHGSRVMSYGAEDNYFRPARMAPARATRPHGRGEEEDLMLELEREVTAAQKERAHYMALKQEFDRERQHFAAYRFNAQHEIDDARAEVKETQARLQREAEKEVKAMTERYRSVSALLSTERGTNTRLVQENETLRTQLEELTTAMREMQVGHRAELARMRRDVDSLTRRNTELLAMAKEQQIRALELGPGAELVVTTTQEGGAVRTASATGGRARSHSGGGGGTPAPAAIDTHTTSPRPAPETTAEAVVLDFTPRVRKTDETDDDAAAAAAARARRAREVELHLRREEEERRRRREQRARETAEVAAQRNESAATPPARRAASSGPTMQKPSEGSATGRKSVPPATTRSAEGATGPSAATSDAVQDGAGDVVQERTAAGHPLVTPRVITKPTQAVGGKTTRPVTAIAAKPPRVPLAHQHIPTRDELIGEVEEMPAEELPNDAVVSQVTIGNNPNKQEVLYRSGKRVIHYSNGTIKTILPSGHTVLRFTNKDVKCTYPSGRSTYWYEAAQTTHTQLPDNVQIFEFHATGQTERHSPGGTKEILYPDGSFKVVHADGTDETFVADDEDSEGGGA